MRAAFSHSALIEHERTRVQTLQQLLEALSAFEAGSDDDEEFAALFRDAQTILELDDYELGNIFNVSRPTISRWARGETAPHSVGRKSVFEVLAEHVETRLKRHSASAQRYEPALAHA
jgi:transcriptional regulator with XRE-family HTH domain